MKKALKPSDRQIITSVADQVEAILFFYGPHKRRKQRRPTVRERDGLLKGLVEIADLINGVPPDHFRCEGCSKPIGWGQAYVSASDDCSIHFHARCAGIPAKDCVRMETPAEIARRLRSRANEARAHLERHKRR